MILPCDIDIAMGIKLPKGSGKSYLNLWRDRYHTLCLLKL